MKLKNTFIILIIALVLLFIPVFLRKWIPIVQDENLIEAAQLAIALVSIFLGAHYELKNIELKLREERKREIRQQKINVLDYIESWLKDVNSLTEDLSVLRDKSTTDNTDSGTIHLEPAKEILLRLEHRGYTVIAKLVDFHNDELSMKIALIWGMLDTVKEMLASNTLPNSYPLITNLADALQAIDRIRLTVLDLD